MNPTEKNKIREAQKRRGAGRGDGKYLIKGKGKEWRETLCGYLSGGVRYARQVKGRKGEQGHKGACKYKGEKKYTKGK